MKGKCKMIRKFKYEDLNSCVQLLIETYNCEPWKNHWTVETATRYLSEFVSSNEFVGFVIEVENNIIGAMFAHKKTWWTNDEVYVDELFIKPTFQNQGYGKALLQHAENYCKEKGLAGLTLLTNPYMPSNDFYLKNGYTLAKHVVFFYKEV